MAHTPLQESPKASVGPRVYAKYACYNRIIQLVGSRLIVVYLPITFKPDRSMGVPFTSGSRDRPKDRRHVEVSLDSAEVEEFVKLVKDTGFLKLSGHYGAPGSYPEAAVTVALDGRKTTADYRIIPRYTGSIRSWLTKPRAFSRVVDWLLKAATEHVADFAAFRSATNPSHRRQ